jgi:hypothetical protein
MEGTATPTKHEGVCTEADMASCAELERGLRSLRKAKGILPNHIEIRLRVKPYDRVFLFILHEHAYPNTPLSMLVVEAPEGTDLIWVRAQAVRWLKAGAPDLERVASPKKPPPIMLVGSAAKEKTDGV